MSDINKDLPGQLVDWLPHDNDGQLCISNNAEVYFRDIEAIVTHALNARAYNVLQMQSSDTWDAYNAAVTGEVHLMEIKQRYLIETIMREVIYPTLVTIDPKCPWYNFTP